MTITGHNDEQNKDITVNLVDEIRFLGLNSPQALIDDKSDSCSTGLVLERLAKLVPIADQPAARTLDPDPSVNRALQDQRRLVCDRLVNLFQLELVRLGGNNPLRGAHVGGSQSTVTLSDLGQFRDGTTGKNSGA